MIPRLKRQTKKRHSVGRVYHATLTISLSAEPIIGAPLTPDVFRDTIVWTGPAPSKRALRRARRLTPDV